MHKGCANYTRMHISLYISILFFWNCICVLYSSTRKHIETGYVETLLSHEITEVATTSAM
jgi:hypothetical protein